MNIIIGVLMVSLAGGAAFFFRPRFKSSRALCVMTGVMGLMTLGTDAGNLGFQLFQFLLQGIVAACCVLQIRRERMVRLRRAARKKAVGKMPKPSAAAKNCA